MTWWTWALLVWAALASGAVLWLAGALTARIELLHALAPDDRLEVFETEPEAPRPWAGWDTIRPSLERLVASFRFHRPALRG
jgi:hypothetical protein